jgi:nitric oxide reductase NorE protein
VEKPLTEKYPPGDFAIWFIIYIELVTFGLLFIGYAFSRRNNLVMFNESQQLLHPTYGFINTLLLISCSYFVVRALNEIKKIANGDIETANRKSSHWLLLSIVGACLFLLIKSYEFSDIFSQGINLSTNKFFMFYLLLTGFHFMHVLLGAVILVNVYQKTKRQGYLENKYQGFESAASYWHMVDLLWIVLFPLVYIIH